MKRFLVGLFISCAAYGATQVKPQGTCEIGATGTPFDLEVTGCEVSGKAFIRAGKMHGTFTIPVRKLEAGPALRTSHMLSVKFLNVDKYPKVKLFLDPVEMGPKKIFKGRLNIKGKTHPVSGKISFQGKRIVASFKVNTKRYDIPKMEYLGAEIDEVFNVEVSLGY